MSSVFDRFDVTEELDIEDRQRNILFAIAGIICDLQVDQKLQNLNDINKNDWDIIVNSVFKGAQWARRESIYQTLLATFDLQEWPEEGGI